jgi:ABC-type Fe3+ transport system permease subunit
MSTAEYNLLIALALIPVVIWLQVWIRKRRQSRRNETGQQEFESLGATLLSTLIEGFAVVFSLILIIWIMGGVLRYFFPMIFNAK